jgi:hypothetical protein
VVQVQKETNEALRRRASGYASLEAAAFGCGNLGPRGPERKGPGRMGVSTEYKIYG